MFAAIAHRLPLLPRNCSTHRSLFKTVSEHFDDDDRPPAPPVRPSQDECCKGSCDPCVFDLYDQAVERYRAALSAWQQRKSAANKEVATPAGPDKSA